MPSECAVGNAPIHSSLPDSITEFGKGEFILSQQRVRQIPVCEIAKQFPTYIVDNSCVSFTKKNGELEIRKSMVN